MLTTVYFGFGMLLAAFLLGLYKLWTTHCRMVRRDAVMTTRMMEATRAHERSTSKESVSTGEPAQGSLWKD